MNLFNIFSEIENIDADAAGRLSYYTRRQLFRRGAKAATAAAVPTLVLSSISEAYADDATVKKVLAYALTLEYLEREFYALGTGAASLIPADDKTVFFQIFNHEAAHVKLLDQTLKSMGVTFPTLDFNAFDYTAGGLYNDVFTNYATFLAVAQAFEDTGVRAYKGRAPELQGSAYLKTALQIHSVEAKHAAEVRRISNHRIWTRASDMPSAVYEGEDMADQAGIKPSDFNAAKVSETLSSYGSTTTISNDLFYESFDEPLTKDKVLTIVTPFIKPAILTAAAMYI